MNHKKNMFDLLSYNIKQNGLEDKIIPINSGVFCYVGYADMNNIDLDGGGGIVQKRYNEEINLGCNFGGIGLGKDGERVKITTIDNVGFIHCDAQGSGNFIFSHGLDLINRDRPVIIRKQS